MARTWYGITPADYAFDPSSGLPAEGAILPVWGALTGGSLVTDLLDASGTPVTQLTTDSNGGYRFQGPDGFQGALYLEGVGGLRYLVFPETVIARLATVETGLSSEVTNRGTAVSAALDAAKAYTDDAVDQHELAGNPHPQYGRLVNPDGTPTGGRIILVGAGGVFPPVEAGSILVYGGS